VSDVLIPFAPVLETPRLVLRAPQAGDENGFITLTGDEENARFIGGVQHPGLAWRGFASVLGHWLLRGYGFFSVIEKDTDSWVGRVGPLNPLGWPQPEVGWSILKSHWGRGYGPEASAAAMEWVFASLGWRDVVHLIAPENTPSQAVARKLGSADTGRDFHPCFIDVTADLWGQSAADWAENRKRFDWLG